MLAARFNISNTILSFLAFLSSATADPVCDLIYGQPIYNDCRDLVLALHDGWPGQTTDRREHYFSIRGEEPPPWINPVARNFREYVPRFVFQGHCKVAMTSIRLLNETTTSDSAYWPDIWLNANSVLTRCVDLGIGGYHHVGSLNRLILTLYAPGSIYDTQIEHILDQGGVVCSKEAVSWGKLPQDSEVISGSISCGSAIELAMQELTSECCNSSTSQIQSIKRGNGTFCFSCGAILEANS